MSRTNHQIFETTVQLGRISKNQLVAVEKKDPRTVTSTVPKKSNYLKRVRLRKEDKTRWIMLSKTGNRSRLEEPLSVFLSISSRLCFKRCLLAPKFLGTTKSI